MGYGGFEMGFFWYAGYEFQKVGEKSGMRDWAPPLLDPHLRGVRYLKAFMTAHAQSGPELGFWGPNSHNCQSTHLHSL